MTEPAYRIESVDKALRLLHMFREKPRWTVSEVSEALGVVPSTAHRLLGMLQWHEFVHQEPGSKAYVAGRALVVIGLAALSHLAVRDVARADLEALSRELGETVHLIVLQGSRTLIVDAVEGDQVVRVGARIGGSAPPNCVSAGKVLLAQMTDRQVATLIGPDPLPRRTSRSIGTLAELTADLAKVRERGFATNFDEHEFGATGVAVPIPVPPDVTPAAITVNAPSGRVPGERIPVIVAAATAAAARIAAKLDPPDSAPAAPPRPSPARPAGRPGRRTGRSALRTLARRLGRVGAMPELQRLHADHAPAVLAFEQANRGYFAAFISDRGDEFFDQFTERHRALLAEQEAGIGAYYVLVDEDGSVLGRFNLYFTGDGTAELGYRVAQHAAGRGVATTTVLELCRLAAAEHRLRTLRAATSLKNVASQKVLAKAGFVPVGPANPADIGGKPGTWYARELGRPRG